LSKLITTISISQIMLTTKSGNCNFYTPKSVYHLQEPAPTDPAPKINRMRNKIKNPQPGPAVNRPNPE